MSRQVKGIFSFKFTKESVMFYTQEKTMEFRTLDDFLYFDFGHDGAAVFAPLEEVNAIYDYLKTEIKEGYTAKLMYISSNIKRVIGFTLKKENSQHCFKTFYDVKYKIGSDELPLEESLKIIEEGFPSQNSGYTSKLRREIKLEDKLCKITINKPPSLTPIIFSHPYFEYENVQCWDITSAYPYLLTQPLPHYDKTVEFTSEDMFTDTRYTYYGRIEIIGLAAKRMYTPLSLIGKNNIGLKKKDQGINIETRGEQIVSADKVVMYGFVNELLELLKRNYNYESYKISSRLYRFELKIDKELRNKMLYYFERKQEKKRNGESYKGEKVLLNRIYGFLLTLGSDTPAHYGQYIVIKEKLILDRLINKIGLKDMVHAHTDSLKFVGNHAAAIEEYNKTVEFPELGRFVLEDVFQKCVYYSHITGKYIDKNGKLGLKHGGINSRGIQQLYKMKYEDITEKTEYFLIRNCFYLKGEGYFPNAIKQNFTTSVSFEKGDD